MALGIAINVSLLFVTIRLHQQQAAAQSETITDVAEATARVVALRLSSLAKEARVLAAEAGVGHNDMAQVEERLHAAAAAGGHHYILGDQETRELINTSAQRGVARATSVEPAELASIFAGDAMIISELRESRYIGELRNGQFRGERFFHIRVPVRVNGEVRYVLTLLARPAVIGEVLAGAYRPDGWGTTVLDQKNRRIARVPDDERLIGEPAPAAAVDIINSRPGAPRGSVEVRDSDGRPSTAALTEIPQTPWRLAVWAHHELLAESRPMSGVWFAFANLALLVGLLLVLQVAPTAPDAARPAVPRA